MQKIGFNKKGVIERCVVYFTPKDRLWVAHGLRTDQIGTGKNIIDAFASFLSGVKNLLALADIDNTIAIFRKAPRPIRNKAVKAKPMPEELCLVAYKKLHGFWPKYVSFQAETMRHRPLVADITFSSLN